jgi:hypothetical protein
VSPSTSSERPMLARRKAEVDEGYLMAEKIPRVCPECGGDRYMAHEGKNYFDLALRHGIKAEGIARENGLLRYKLSIAESDASERVSGMQRKVIRQARVIRRLEERVKQLGAKPYEGATLDETAPGAEYDAGKST